MALYRSKPVVKEAFRYNIDARPDWFMDKVSSQEIKTYSDYCKIGTLEGIMTANMGDYIVKGIQGEIYPCKPDIFEASYEKIDWE